MHFKKLELVGFKSFAQKTTFRFEPGITAIVGPNGCGKSNIVEAIMWVLGEQNIRTLRGLRMEDVIFNGTASQGPVGLAEVSLTISNHPRILPIDYQEVNVTRRIFRSGESEYLLNKAKVRLKDINGLFLNTGIGTNFYSLVEQGKIEALLNSRAEERRFIFEEASGIAGFKSKKKEALQKLENTENNLLRVEDIRNEVKRQINSLQRQADKARRYNEEFERLKGLEKKKASSQFKELELNREKKAAEIKEFKQEEALLLGQIEQLSKDCKDTQVSREEINQKVSSLQTKSAEVCGAIDRDKNRISLDKERLTELKQRQVALREESKHLSKRISVKDEQLKGLEKELFLLEDSHRLKESLQQEKERLLKEILQSIKASEEKIAQAKADSLQLASQNSHARNELARISASIQSGNTRARRLKAERENVLKEIETIDDRLAVVSSQVEESNLNFTSMKEALDKYIRNVKLLENEISSLNAGIKDREDEILRLQSQLQLLEGLKGGYEPISSGQRAAFITPHLPKEKIRGIIAKVVETVNLEEKYKPYLKEILGGGASFYLLNCEAKFISLSLEEIKGRLSILKEEIVKISQHKKGRMDSLDSARERIEKTKLLLHEAELELANRQAIRRSVETEKRKLEEEIVLVNSELDDIRLDLEDLRANEKDLNRRLLEIDSSDRQTQNLISQAQGHIASSLQAKEETLIFIAKIKAEITSLSERESAKRASLEILRSSLEEEMANLHSRKEDLEGSLRREVQLGREVEELEAEIQSLFNQKALLDTDLTRLTSQRDGLIQTINELEGEVENKRKDLERLRERINISEREDLDLSFKQEALKRRIKETYGIDLEQEASFTISPEELEKIKEEIACLKQRIASLGAVNPTAVEEYESLNERFAFLTQQRQDLLEAKSSVLKAIEKIDRTARELFMEAFKKIQTEFKNFFKLLFGGGEADIMLLDRKDVLESGIEVVARPPGKRLTTLCLLSGGEKALTTIALLFSLLKVKPSPFCILDEVDAPLDESNIGRFSKALQELARDSQFIIITHNKQTITMANCIYGITMEKSGISKVVSVRLAEKD